MSGTSGSRAVIGVLTLTVVLVAGACRGDGRDLRDPTAPLPPTTTTSTTLPPDIVAPGTVAPGTVAP